MRIFIEGPSCYVWLADSQTPPCFYPADTLTQREITRFEQAKAINFWLYLGNYAIVRT